MPTVRIRLSFLVAICTLVLAVPAGALADSPAASDVSAQHYYVALGDSLAEGYQPNGDVGHGYADQLYAALKADDPTLQLVNLGCGGESAVSMLNGSQYPWIASSCGPPSFYQTTFPVGGTQLSQAVSFLHAHRQFVRLVTIDIGGNDIALCIYLLDQACLANGLSAINHNLPIILSTLREAAGPDVPIVGMNYYNPFLVFWFGSPADAATTNQMMVGQVNPALEQAYAGASAPVADVETAFSTTDWTLVDGIPLNVLRICQWTWMCDPTYPPQAGIHANTEGYGVIAHAFEDVLP